MHQLSFFTICVVTLFSPPTAAVVNAVVGGFNVNKVFSSSDGQTWNVTTSPFGTATVNDVCFSPELDTWLLCGDSTAKLALSGDGVSWTTVATPTFSGSASGCVWGGGLFVVVGFDGGSFDVAWSTNGSVWNRVQADLNGGTAIAYSPEQRRWVASGGSNGLPTHSLAYSLDGKAFVGLGNFIFFRATGVTWSSTVQRWVAVGYAGSGRTTTVAHSSDGMTWASLGDAIKGSGNGVAFGNGVFFAGMSDNGFGNTFATSVDGIAWSSKGFTPFLNENEECEFSSILAKWVCVGGQGTVLATTTNNGQSFATFPSALFQNVISLFGVAVRTTLDSPVSSGSSVVSGDAAVALGANVTVATLNVGGNLRVLGRLFIPAGSSVTVGGSVILTGTLDVSSARGQFAIGNDLSIFENASLALELATPPMSGSGVLSVPILAFTKSVGAFSSLSLRTALSTCVAFDPPEQSFSSNTLTVTVAYTSPSGCDSSTGLPTGAVVGIAVGVTVAGLLLGLGVIALIVLQRRRRTQLLRGKLAARTAAMQDPHLP